MRRVPWCGSLGPCVPLFLGDGHPKYQGLDDAQGFPMKGGMTIPNIRSLDPGTCKSYVNCAQVCRLSKVKCLLSYGVLFLVGSTSLVVCMFGVEDFEFTGMVFWLQ